MVTICQKRSSAGKIGSIKRSQCWQEAYTDWTLGSSVPSVRLQKVPSLICSQRSLVCPSWMFLTG